MKPFAGIVLSLACSFVLASAAHAAGTRDKFTCKTDKVIEGRGATEVKFVVLDLDSRKAELEDKAQTGEPVTMKPKNSVLDLNDNIGFKVSKEQLEITADGDGCQWTTFVVYSNTNFSRGFVRVKGDAGCGSGDFYSTLKCDHVRD